MALRRALGWSDGELMRSDAKPCSRLMRHTAGIFSVGGGLAFWVLCRLHYVAIVALLFKGNVKFIRPWHDELWIPASKMYTKFIVVLYICKVIDSSHENPKVQGLLSLEVYGGLPVELYQ